MNDQEDLEFSNIGRSERFLPGWWFVPSVVIGTIIWAVILF